MKRRRNWIAALLVFGVIFAQTMAAAHACAILAASPVPSSGAASSMHAMPTDCADMAKHSSANSEPCASHCYGGEQATAQVYTLLPPAAPQPPLIVRVANPLAQAFVLASAPRPIGVAPPLLLLSGRLLI